MSAVDTRTWTVSMRLVWSFGRAARKLGVPDSNPNMPLSALESASGDTRVPWSMVEAGLEWTASVADAPHLGILAAEELHPEDLGALMRALQAQPILGDAQALNARTSRILADGIHMWTRADPRGQRLCVDGLPPLTLADELADFAVASQIQLARHLLQDPNLAPLEVGLRHPPPRDPAPYEAFFRCPVRFAAEGNYNLVSTEHLALPLPLADAYDAATFTAGVEAELGALPEASITQRAEEMILARLKDGAPTADEVAARLGMSTRQLHRRLSDEGLTYRALLDRTRKNLAREYLERTDLTMVTISEHLGFSSVHAFNRATRRLLGASPTAVRKRPLQS